MNTEEALAFLGNRQPMAPTQLVSGEDVALYEEARLHFLNNPDERCVPLFLNSFGEGYLYGIYQLVEDVITQFPPAVVIPYLENSLKSPVDSVRYWSAQIAEQFADRRLSIPLMQLLTHSELDIRSAAATALSSVEGQDVSTSLAAALAVENSEELRSILTDILSTRAMGK